MHTSSMRAAFLAGSTLTALAAPAFAQDTAISGVSIQGAGVVAKEATSASKSDIPLLELPRAVSVVTAEEIRDRSADTLTRIFEYTAGFNGDAYGGGPLSRSYSNVRGFLAYQYIDGLKQHDSNWGIEPFGLERAELIKGPASALYGQASPGGLINLISKRPTQDPVREVQVQFGSHSRLQGAFDFGGRLDAAGKLSVRLTALTRDAETDVRFQKDDRTYIAPAITWRPSDRTEVTLLASYQSDPNLTVFQYLPNTGTVVASPLGYVPRNTFTGEPAFDDSHIKRYQAALLLQHRLTDHIVLRESVRHTKLDITARYLQAGAVQSN
ncbi:MAG: TonB-dependent siderophore receptor, partial [Caulobacteraceae bacterium]